MTTLRDTSLVLRKQLVPLIFFLSVSLLLSLIYSKYKNITNPPIPAPSPPTIKQNIETTPSSYRITTDLPKTPDKLSTYTFNKNKLDDNQAIKIASSFGIKSEYTLKENTYSGLQYSFDEDTRHLSINQTEIRYMNSAIKNTAGQKTEDELANTAQTFTNNLGIYGNELVLNNNKTKYLTIDGDVIRSTSKETAQVYEFSMDISINSYQILTDTREPTFGRLKINKSGEIVETNFKYPILYLEEENYELKNIKSAIRELMDNKGTIVAAQTVDQYGQSQDLYNFSPVDIKEATIDKIYIAYLLPIKNSPSLQPIYVFEGTFTSSGNQAGTITVYVPAISSQP